MPEMRFDIEWPDCVRQSCYSPSLVIKDHLTPGQGYTVADFLQRSRTALNIASDRVKAKYGFSCSRALGQVALIENAAARYSQTDMVSILSFHDL